mmetsp:Transcript_79638/g.234225  ORF Transcript_79638/g.234225 Transcript_79638/m.234225 type:complete len:323 (-) Transcript_79638:177-1145(-)
MAGLFALFLSVAGFAHMASGHREGGEALHLDVSTRHFQWVASETSHGAQGKESKKPTHVYDAKREWTNSLFLDFADGNLSQEIVRWRHTRGLSDFPLHATLCTVGEALFRPDAPETPKRVADAVQEVWTEFLKDEKVASIEMHVDGLLKFGDYKPHKMRMLQIEAVGNFIGQGFEAKKTVDGGEGLRKLYPPGGLSKGDDYAASPPAKDSEALIDYGTLQLLRAKLCEKLGDEKTRAAQKDVLEAVKLGNIDQAWKPHLSAAYVNEGDEEGLSEQDVLQFQTHIVDQKLVPQKVKAVSISYWEMRGKTASQWFEQSRASLLA